jgi:hypothetical protein
MSLISPKFAWPPFWYYWWQQVKKYRAFHNSLTHFTKSVHLNGRKESNVPPTYRNRNFPGLFVHAAGRLILSVAASTSISICPKLDRKHGRRRQGAASLATKIAWLNAMGCVNDSVFLAPLPQDLPELRRRITAAVSVINRDMLQRVWVEMDYRLDVCVTKGGHQRALTRYAKRKSWRVSLYLLVAYYNPFRYSSIRILWNVSGNFE